MALSYLKIGIFERLRIRKNKLLLTEINPQLKIISLKLLIYLGTTVVEARETPLVINCTRSSVNYFSTI